jgi:hypothetical protein
MLITSSLTANMAYLASDGFSAITDGNILWLDIQRQYRERMAQRQRQRILDGYVVPHRIADKADRLIDARAEIQNELTLEMNGMLSTPLAVLDFDIFSISEEDAFDSLHRRGLGQSGFGYEFIDHIEDLELWDEDKVNHSTDPDYPEEFCRTNQCDGECWY